MTTLFQKPAPYGTSLTINPQALSLRRPDRPNPAPPLSQEELQEAVFLMRAKENVMLGLPLTEEMRKVLLRHPSTPLRPSFVAFRTGTLEALLVRVAWFAGEQGSTDQDWESELARYAAQNRGRRVLPEVLKSTRMKVNKKLAVIGFELAPRCAPKLIPLRQKKSRR